MASKTGLIPAKVKAQVKTKLTVISARKSMQAQVQPGKQTNVSNIKRKNESLKPLATFRRDPPAKKLTSSSVASKLVKNGIVVTSKDKSVPPGKVNGSMRRSHPGFVLKERTLPKHATPSRKSFAVGQPTPKSILKKDADILDTEKKSIQVLDNADSRHVQFKNKAAEQAVMRAKLDAWLKAKGRTSSASKFRHSGCFNKPSASAASQSKVTLLDRTITQNLLSQQMDVLKNEAVKKKLFSAGHQSTTEDDKENSQQSMELPCTDALDINDNAANPICQEVADTLTEQDGVQHGPLDNFLCERDLHEGMMSEKVLSKIQTMLEESLHLLDAGCPLESILTWFTELEANMPQALTLAIYYIHKAKVVAAFPQMVLDVFCEAVRNNAQPSQIIAAEMKRTFSQWLSLGKDNKPVAVHDAGPGESNQILGQGTCTETTTGSSTPRHADSHQRGPRVGSTVKYSISSVKRLVVRTPANSTVAVVTPVRRSARVSSRPPPGSARLRREVDSISDLSSAERQSMLFKVNPALTDK